MVRLCGRSGLRWVGFWFNPVPVAVHQGWRSVNRLDPRDFRELNPVADVRDLRSI